MDIHKTDKTLSGKILSGSLLRMGNLVAAVAAALWLMPLMVHRLGDRNYGFWSLAGAFIGYYGLIDLGLSSAVSQYLCVALGKKDEVECRAVFNTALRMQLFLGCVALLATTGIAASAHWLCRNPSDASLFWKVILVLGIAAAFGFPMRVYAGVLEAQFRFDIQAKLDFLGLILRTGLTALAMLAGRGILTLASVTLIASLPVMMLQMSFAKKEAPWARIGGTSFDRKRAKGLFSYSIYSFLTYIGDVFRFQVDALVIAGFVSMAAITHYRVSSVLMRYYVNVITSSVGTFQQVSSRLYGEGNHQRLESAFFFATKIAVWLSVAIGFILIFWGKPFILRWMGPGYRDAYLPMVVLTCAVFLDISQFPSISLLYATFNHRFYTYINLAEGIVNLVLSLILCRTLGILGVALGTLIAALLIRIAVQPWWVCKAVGISRGKYFGFVGWNLLRCVFLMGAAVALSAWDLKTNYAYLAISASGAAALYAAGSWFLVFNGPERKKLLAAISSRGKVLATNDLVVVAH